MDDGPDAYQAYLLRLWRVPLKGKRQWRASLESPHTGERQVFAGLQQLFIFLAERCDDQVAEEEEGRCKTDSGTSAVCPRRGTG